MKKTIKGILIDSEKKEIREVELIQENGSTNKSIYKELKCDYITSACSGTCYSQPTLDIYCPLESCTSSVVSITSNRKSRS
jgi:hypothetical protein